MSGNENLEWEIRTLWILFSYEARTWWHVIENEDLTIGRNLFPSTPILKKCSAAVASFGTYKIEEELLYYHYNSVVSQRKRTWKSNTSAITMDLRLFARIDFHRQLEKMDLIASETEIER